MPVQRLSAEQWELLRSARLSALAESPDSFGGDLAEEAGWPEARWRELLVSDEWGVLTESNTVVGLANVRPALDADDADCWIRSWWIAPERRGAGLSAELLAWVDDRCREHEWARQGLGVWCDNRRARALFARLGFVEVGGEQRSRAWGDRCYVRMIRVIGPEPADNPDARGQAWESEPR